MKRKIIKTEDGSPTLFVPELQEHYHSIHGATTESCHIFIKAAFCHSKKENINVLEFGLGTGLNAVLTALKAAELNKTVYYYSIEKYPLTDTEMQALIIEGLNPDVKDVLINIHQAPWGEKSPINNHFVIRKEKMDFLSFHPEETFDVVYFDAFAPEIQPKLWTADLFLRIFNVCNKGAVFTTYSAKGMVKRNLLSAGFSIEKIPGPPGKREFIRATKP